MLILTAVAGLTDTAAIEAGRSVRIQRRLIGNLLSNVDDSVQSVTNKTAPLSNVAENVVPPTSPPPTNANTVPVVPPPAPPAPPASSPKVDVPVVNNLLRPVNNVVENSTPPTTAPPLTNNVVKPVADSTVKPLTDNVIKPVADSTVKPLTDNVIKPVADNTVRPLADNVVEPVADVVEPITKPLNEPLLGNPLTAPSSSS
ncbi:hypothetical protein SYNPS1DRAFT_14006, partial [Syncephalis pseudoplumigaleata]